MDSVENIRRLTEKLGILPTFLPHNHFLIQWQLHHAPHGARLVLFGRPDRLITARGRFGHLRVGRADQQFDGQRLLSELIPVKRGVTAWPQADPEKQQSSDQPPGWGRARQTHHSSRASGEPGAAKALPK